MLTPEKLKELRELAEDGVKRSYAPGFFPIFLNPQTVLNLLDEIEQLRAQVAVIREKVDAVLESWEAYSDYLAPDELKPKQIRSLRDSIEELKRTLSTDAGREMLEKFEWLRQEIERLGNYLIAQFLDEIGKGNPRDGESAVDVAIRLLGKMKKLKRV